MKIREGAYYRTRGGDVVGPMKPRDDSRYCWESGTDCWTDKGEFEKDRQWEHDLISEVYASDTPPAAAPAPEAKTLRDEFAMAALPVVWESSQTHRSQSTLASQAYTFADAMMEARKK
jgi:hypothetical protein